VSVSSVARRADLAYAIGVVIAFGILYGSGFVEERSSGLVHTDFAVMWTGARALVDGGDPYAPASYAATVARYGTNVNGVEVFTYPPWIAFALVPLGLLPLDVAGAVWTYGTLALAIAGLGALLRAFVPSLPIVHGLVGFALLASQPGVATFYSGQWGFLLIAALAAIILGARSRNTPTGVLAVILLAKPQLFVFSGWALVRSAVARGARGHAAAAVVAVAIVAVATAAFASAQLQAWLRYVAFARPNDPTAPTLPAFFVDLFGPGGVIVAVVVLLVALAAGSRFTPAGDAWLAVWLALSVVAATYARSYDQVVLLVPLTIAAGTLASRSRVAAVRFAAGSTAVLTIGSIVLYAVAAAREREDTSALIGIVLLSLIVAVLWPQRREPAR